MIFVFINILTFLLRLVVFCDRAIHKCSPPHSPLLLLSLSFWASERHAFFCPIEFSPGPMICFGKKKKKCKQK